jgi:threonine dehydratase
VTDPPGAERDGAAVSAVALTLEAIRAARERIAPHVLRTPLLPFHPQPGVWLKVEGVQPTGSFKVRGAASHLTTLPPGLGVITASSGNHGQAVAYVAARLGRPATVVVPEDVPAVKAEGIARWGARLLRHGRTSEERIRLALDLAEREGLAYVPPFDDPLVMAGQGTVGLEIVEDLPEVRAVLVPVSGGGLISGVAVAVKGLRPQAAVLGIEPALLPRFARSRAAGHPVRLPFAPTVADGLRVLEPGRVTWEVTRACVDDFVAVPEEAILEAVRRLLLQARLVVEPSGAVGLAALLTETVDVPRPAVIVLSGSNVDPDLLARVLALPTL